MTEAEEYREILKALDLSYDALRAEAQAEHAKTRPPRGAIVTHDMCRCGETTGLGRTEKCNALRTIGNLIIAYRTALEKAGG